MVDYSRKKSEYERTIKALIALKKHFEFEHGCKTVFCKNLVSTEHNKISKNVEITPDLIAYKKDLSEGWVIEVKSCLSNPKNRSPDSKYEWEKEIEQLIKYDDDLKGWDNNENLVVNHSIIGCMGMDWCRKFIMSFQNYLKDKNITLSKKILIIQFAVDDMTVPFLKFQAEYGENEVLPYLKEKTTLSIKMENVDKDFTRIKIYDDFPPLPYLMSLLWFDVFMKKPTPDEWRESRDNNKYPRISMDLNEIHEALFQKDGPPLVAREIRQKKVPEIGWIKKAMGKFESLKLAEKDKKDPDKYTIKLKKISLKGEDLDEYFYEKLRKKGEDLDELC